MSFSHRFCIEAKEFQVTVLGNGVVKLSKWSWKALSSIFLGRFGAVWMVNMASRLQVDVNKEFVIKFNEASRAFIAQRCSNKVGRYVAIAEFGEGRRTEVVMIPEGNGGSGWKVLANVFQEVVFHFGQLQSGRGGSSDSRVRKEVSFAEAAKRGSTGESSGGRAPLASDASFSNELSFNTKSAEGKVVDVTFWRTRLMGIREEIDALLVLLGLDVRPDVASSDPVVKSAWVWKEKLPTQDLVKDDGLGSIPTNLVEVLSQPKYLLHAQVLSEGGGQAYLRPVVEAVTVDLSDSPGRCLGADHPSLLVVSMTPATLSGVVGKGSGDSLASEMAVVSGAVLTHLFSGLLETQERVRTKGGQC
ncbi:hypothetical protein CJ030_MR7G027342 [Morella rubra]|uniref:Uncharacterized protein n=1 Tax=Morella rubra TaxID=262757 RepID=A0A6A1V768_9ROSI|nr:hypothetical protein CJ030_MR7G027342 [Morella rubra]